MCNIAVAPSRERGLKYLQAWVNREVKGRSFTGAWIEINQSINFIIAATSLLHGSVKEKLKKHLTNINNERKVNVR